MILKTASQFTKDYLCLHCSTNCRPYIQLCSKVSHPLNNNCKNTWVWRLSSWSVEGQGKKYRPKFFFRKQQLSEYRIIFTRTHTTIALYCFYCETVKVDAYFWNFLYMWQIWRLLVAAASVGRKMCNIYIGSIFSVANFDNDFGNLRENV